MNLEGMRAVVIDDEYEEVKALFLALDKKGISYNYYSNSSNFPIKKLTGIRLIFLDFELETTKGGEPKMKVSMIQNYLDKILSGDNGPYILIIWAKSPIKDENKEILNLLKERLPKSHTSLPLLILKNFNKEDLYCNSEKILDEIEKSIKSNKIINIIFQWEQFGHKALNETLRNFIGENKKTINLDNFIKEVDIRIKNDFKKYAELELGKNGLKDKSILQIPQMLLNDFFKEKSDFFIMEQDYCNTLIDEIINIEPKEYNETEKAKINTLFNLNFNESFNKVKPGKVYCVDDIFLSKFDIQFDFKNKELKEKIIETYFYKPLELEAGLESIKIIAMEITPECDFSQNNWKTNKIIFGILIPESLRKKMKKSGSLPKSTSKPLFICNKDKSKNYFISFNCLFFKTIKKESISDIHSIFSLRKPFLFEIQQLFANHSSRLGKIEFN